MCILQADSNCLIDATGVTDADDDTGSSHSIEWLKWTGAAILFVEALVVSAMLLQLCILKSECTLHGTLFVHLMQVCNLQHYMATAKSTAEAVDCMLHSQCRHVSTLTLTNVCYDYSFGSVPSYNLYCCTADISLH